VTKFTFLVFKKLRSCVFAARIQVLYIIPKLALAARIQILRLFPIQIALCSFFKGVISGKPYSSRVFRVFQRKPYFPEYFRVFQRKPPFKGLAQTRQIGVSVLFRSMEACGSTSLERLLCIFFLKVWSLENPTLLGFLGFSRENPTFQSILGFSRENRNLLGFRGFLVVVNPVLDRWKAWLKRDILEYPCFSAQWRHVVPQVWKNFSLWIFLKAFSGKPYFLGFFRVFQR